MKLRRTAALVVAVLALSACGTDSSSTDAGVVTTTATSRNAEAQPGSSVDNFVAKTVGGETFVLSNALAQKPVVLWFWAPG